jgi:ferredoxin
MDCFMEGPNFLVINPDECIDCSMCVPECPVNAIVGENEIAQDQAHFIQLNRDLSRNGGWKRITKVTGPLPNHEEMATVNDKLGLLVRSWEAG